MTTENPLGFSLKSLPAWIRAANAAADVLGAGTPDWSPERLMAKAARVAGLPPKFPPHVHEALEVLCRSLREECNLHWLGVSNTENLVVTGLAAMLRVEAMFAADHSLAREPLLSPIVVVGMPRSGTTFLHRLLSASPDAVGVPMHRHMMPVSHSRIDYRRLYVSVLFLPWLAASHVYGLDAIHFVRPDLPDECNFGMRLGGRSMLYWAMNPVHTYLRWLLAQDLRESYQLYRKVLILHQRANPGRRLTLKCPHHLAWLPALVEALPEATIVQTHRDLTETIPSECKLILSLQGISVRELDWRRTVESNQLKVLTFAQRSVAFSRTQEGQRVHHVDYKQLLRDPVNVARAVHTHAGVDFTETHRTILSSFIENNKQHKHGHNRYKADDFGLDPAKISRDFAEYNERFL